MPPSGAAFLLVQLRELFRDVLGDGAGRHLNAVAVLIVGELVLRQDVDLRAGAGKVARHNGLHDAVLDTRVFAQARGGVGDLDRFAVGCDSLARKGVETLAKKRKSGTGTVRQRKDGRWEGRVVIGYDDSGLPKTKNVLAKTKRECQEKLRQLTEGMVGRNDRKVKSDMLFGDWLCYWYENHSKPTLRASTQDNYENVIHNHVLPEIGKIPLNKLSQNDLQQFYGRLKKNGRKRLTEQYGAGLSDRMVRMCHAVCRSALERAVRDDLLRTNPAIGCKLPPKKAKEMQVLDREELQKFLIQAQADGYYELFLLDLCTGLRRGELIALQWDDLNFETGVLTVNKQAYTVNGELQIIPPKTKASVRKLVLPPAVLAVLREYRKKVDSRWMFPSPVKADRPITPGVARRRLQTILERADCKRVRFHDLRHPYVKHTTKNKSLQKQKSQATTEAWDFCFYWRSI